MVWTDGRADGLTVTWLPNFLGWIDNQIFLATGLWSFAKDREIELQG